MHNPFKWWWTAAAIVAVLYYLPRRRALSGGPLLDPFTGQAPEVRYEVAASQRAYVLPRDV